jgi:hypothetical protein
MDLKLTNFNSGTCLVKESRSHYGWPVIRENILRLLGKNWSHLVASLLMLNA